MSTTPVLRTVLPMIVGETRTFVFDWTEQEEVANGETLSNPSVAVAPAVGLASSGEAVTAAAVDDVRAGKGVSVTLVATAPGVYVVSCSADTSSGATRVRRGVVTVEDEP